MSGTHGGAAAIVAVLATAGLMAGDPARAADIYVQLSPSTVQAGHLAGIRASCRDNLTAATVESPAFGMVTVQPQHGVLTAAAMVPLGTDAGRYRVKLDCPDGASASTRLAVVAAGTPTRGPATGFGGAAGRDRGGLLLPGGLGLTVAGLALAMVAMRRRGSRTVHGCARR